MIFMYVDNLVIIEPRKYKIELLLSV